MGLPTDAPEFGFTSQRYVDAIGIYDYGARWYHPVMARFIQPDALVPDPADPQSFNRYSYVRNSPLARVDPTGNWDVGFGSWTFDFGSAVASTFSFLGGLFGGQTFGSSQGTASQGGREYPADFIGPLGPTDARGPVPLAPPRADVDANTEEARSQWWNPLSILWFRDQVRNKGPWDYKQQGDEYQNFGNFNYGATGAALGLSRDLLLREAGRAQQAAGTSRPEWGNPGVRIPLPIPFYNYGGVPPYGDDPVNDVPWINRGYDYGSQ